MSRADALPRLARHVLALANVVNALSIDHWQRCSPAQCALARMRLSSLCIQRTMGCDAFESTLSHRVRVVPLCPPPCAPNAWLCILPPFTEPHSPAEIVAMHTRWLISMISNPELMAWMCSRSTGEKIRHLWTKSSLQVDAPRNAEMSATPQFTRLITLASWLMVMLMLCCHAVAIPLGRPLIDPSAVSVIAMLHFVFNVDTSNGRLAPMQIVSVLGLSFGVLIVVRMSCELGLWNKLIYKRHVESARRGGGEAEIAEPRIENPTVLRALAALTFFGCEMAWAAFVWMPVTISNLVFFATVCALFTASMMPSVQVSRFVTRSESHIPSWSVDTEYGDPIAPLRPYRLARAQVQKLQISAAVSVLVFVSCAATLVTALLNSL
jgi:hypothetical protein